MGDDTLSEFQALRGILEQLDEDQLLTLNRLVVDRLERIRSSRKAASMAGFELGDAVLFHDKQGQPVRARVIRRNKKTLSLVTDGGERWNVAPELCELEQSMCDDLFESPPGCSGALPAISTVDHSADQWSGGICEMPGLIGADGQEPFRASIIIWLNADGLVVGNGVIAEGDDVIAAALTSLHQAMAAPKVGQAQRPKKIVVNDEKLASALGSQLAGIDIKHGTTMSLNQAFQRITGLVPAATEEKSFLQLGLDIQRIAAFFDAAADLYRSQPWTRVPHEDCLIGVSIPAFRLHNAVLSIIGQGVQRRGLLLHTDLREYGRYLIASDCDDRDTDWPAQTALYFEGDAFVSPRMRDEIAEYGWQVADAKGYPVLFNIDDNAATGPMTAQHVSLYGVLSRALVVALEEHRKLMQAWNGGSPFQRDISVDFGGESIDVEITAPYPFALGYASTTDPSDTIMIRMAQLAHWADEPDHIEYIALIEELLDKFTASPEGKNVASFKILLPLMHFALSCESCTIATLQPNGLKRILLEIVPIEVRFPASQAGQIITCCRAFYKFLRREYGLQQAEQCLNLLDHSAVTELGKALADASVSGPGRVADADTDVEWLPLVDPFAAEGFDYRPAPSSKPVDSRAKKRKRKAARKARKKNR